MLRLYMTEKVQRSITINKKKRNNKFVRCSLMLIRPKPQARPAKAVRPDLNDTLEGENQFIFLHKLGTTARLVARPIAGQAVDRRSSFNSLL